MASNAGDAASCGCQVSRGVLEIRHDAESDVYVVRPHWTIETEADCVAWVHQYEDAFLHLSPPLDVILELGDFRLGSGIGPTWGRYRAEMMKRLFRFSVRVQSDPRVATFVATSAALHQSHAHQAPDVASALELILRLRAAAAAPADERLLARLAKGRDVRINRARSG